MNDEMRYLTETISKQNVEDSSWFLLIAIIDCKMRKMN